MKKAKQFLHEMDQIIFDVTTQELKSKLSEAIINDTLVDLIKTTDVESYKQKSLIDYINNHKDSFVIEEFVVPDEPVVEVQEQKCIAVMEDGTVVRILLESIVGAEELIEEHLESKVIVVFPEDVSTFMSDVITEDLTHQQETKRDEIVLALNKSKTELESRYGEIWESVVYSVATKKAKENNV